MQRNFLSISLLLLAAAPICQATDFCVTTPQQFQNALIEASFNGQDDHIKVRKGTYDVSTITDYFFGKLTYAGTYDRTSDLKVSGGWVSQGRSYCAAQSEFSSKLTGAAWDAEGVPIGPLLKILPGESGNIEVGRLYFYDHLSLDEADEADPTCGAGLSIGEWGIAEMQHTGTIKVHHNRFVLNEADTGAGLCIMAPYAESVDVSNNLFMDNHAWTYSGAARINTDRIDTEVTILNNTVMDNEADWWNGGISLWGEAGQVYIANNILWDNSDSSLYLDYTIEDVTAFIHNDSDYIMGIPYIWTGNLMVQPQFQYCGYFCFYTKVLDPASPLVNAGLNYWQNSPIDLAGKPRLVGSGIDIGAYETQPPRRGW